MMRLRTQHALALILAAGPATSVAAPRFVLPFDAYALDQTVPAFGAADLNDDGRPDLVFGERAFYIVRSPVTMLDSTVFFSKVGAFQAGPGGVLVPAPSRIRVDEVDVPGYLGFADFDEDGRTDIAVAGNGTAILLDRGHEGVWDWEPHYGPSSLRHTYLPAAAVGDFDGDGHMDLAVSLYERGTDVWILRGDGAGGLAIGPITHAGDDNYFTSIAADFNGDGRLDLAVSGNNSVRILMNRGDGVFGSSPLAGTRGRYIYACIAADFDRDGLPDLAFVDFGGRLEVWHGPSLATPFVVASALPETRQLVAADVDSDGFMDIVTMTRVESRADVYRGRGDGTFSHASAAGLGSAPDFAVVSDLNGDGAPDLAVTSERRLAVLWNHGGRFTSPRAASMGTRAVDVAVADLDGDGVTDVAVSNPDSGLIAIRSGRSDFSFAARRAIDVGGSPRKLRIADWNRDGEPDLVFLDGSSGRVAFVPGQGGGRFGARVDLDALPATDFAIGDLDGDGTLDLVTVDPAHFGVLRLLYAALGDGHGGLRPRHDFELPAAPSQVLLRDFDGDGRIDAVLPCPDAHAVAVLRSNSDGTFFPSTSIATDGKPLSLVCADLDRDGDVDLAYTRAGENGVTVMRRVGAGFDRPATRRTGGPAAALVDADLDGDGWSDMLCIKPPWLGVAALDGRTALTSADAYDLGAGHATSYAVADADGDGLPEIWIADDATGGIAVLTNRSERTAVALEEFEATPVGDRTRLVWRFGQDGVGAFATVTVEQAPAATGPWSACSPALPVTERMSFDVGGGLGGMGETWFRLALAGTDGRRDWSAPIATAAAASGTRIAAVRERGRGVAIDFSLAPARVAQLAVFDVRGRRLQAWKLDHAPGTHHIEWNRLDSSGARVARGIVFVRLEAGSVRRDRKVVLVQP